MVPSEWVRDATTSAVGVTGGLGGTGYGYQWWVTEAAGHPAFAAIGFGGQIIEVVPDLGLVVVASTWFDDDVNFDSRIWEAMTSMVLAPAFGPGSAARHLALGHRRLDLDLPGLRHDVDDEVSLRHAVTHLALGPRTLAALGR